MGWFWSDAQPARAVPPHPVPVPGAEPPPGCPMHNSSSPALSKEAKPSACPVKRDSNSASPSYISKLNPLNYMPSNLSNTRDSSHQSVDLSLDRETSTIPRGDRSGTWEYPSPQQMYNAMLRKGYTDTPAEHVTAMVAVHNFLNEGAWDEIRGWEARFQNGLAQGWQNCKHGEQGAERQIALQRLRSGQKEDEEPTLVRFMGRPNELTPKARMLAFMANVWPSQFPDNPPFDRHDWFVGRKGVDGQTREVRYVIDYYSGPPEPNGEPVFFLDVRPALDSPSAVCERAMRWGGDLWYRGTGGSVREELARRKNKS